MLQTPSSSAHSAPTAELASSLSDSLSTPLPTRDIFQRALAQTARLISITTPLPDAVLVAERFHGKEALSTCYAFDIDCLSSNAHLELKQFIGEELTLRLLLADGRSHRQWHGLVTRAAQLGADGGLARYRLTLSPWLSLLAHRRTSRIFQDKTVEEIVSEVFAHYPLARFSFELNAPLSPRSLCCQYRETDLEFVQRLLASEGLSYRFAHDQAAQAGTAGESLQAMHTLVIFDAASPLPDSAQPDIRFHRSAATEASDSIHAWTSAQSVTSNTFTRASWDYKQLLAPAGSGEVDARPLGGLGEVPSLEDFEASGAYRYADAEVAEQAAMRAAGYQALAMAAHRIESSVRVLAPGERFRVSGHPVLQGEAARQTVWALIHEAVNNLDSGAAKIHGALQGSTPAASPQAAPSPVERGSYRNRAVCVSAALPVLPRPLPKPAVNGVQTAVVVGSAAVPMGTGTQSERDGRVKIQFPWQRGARPLNGTPASETERATLDESNGTWVRVAEWLAGPNWGSSFTPRVGTEVLVEFVEGDVDRPLVVAQLYNGQDAPPWPAGEGSQANHPGLLSGWHVPTLDGAGWSQWQLDDATGQLRSRLASSAQRSELNLGFLIHQAPGSSTRGAYRGQGFELRTDGWGVLRAAQGMLVSTTARMQAASTQLDTGEVAAQLKAAHDTAMRLSDAASQSEADALAQAPRIEAFRALIHPQAAPADGTDPTDRAVPAFTAPALLLETPDSLALATPQSSALFASAQLSVTTQADTQLSAQHTMSLVAGEATSLYTHAGGIKAIAANAPLSIQAHDGPLEVLADQDVTVTSSNDEIHILASSKIVLQAGQSSITLDGANITFACPGKFTVKGGQNVLAGGARAAASLGSLPVGAMGLTKTQLLEKSPYDEQFRAVDKGSGQPVVGQPYRIETAEGDVIKGITDKDGKTQRVRTLDPQGLKLYWLSNDTNELAATGVAEQEC